MTYQKLVHLLLSQYTCLLLQLLTVLPQMATSSSYISYGGQVPPHFLMSSQSQYTFYSLLTFLLQCTN
ncbi:hypothetical protein QTP88_028592 [Uroleucon formosanum]